MGTTSALSRRISDILAVDPGAPAVEFEGRWRSWGTLATTVEAISAMVPHEGAEVGVLLRNRPASVGMLLGVLAAGGCVVAINPGRGVDRTRADVEALDLPAIAGEPEDIDEFVPSRCRAVRIASGDLGAAVETSGRTGAPPTPGRCGVAVRMLTSGTTGEPKRVELTYRTLERVLAGARHYESGDRSALKLRRGVAVVNSPLVHLGGLFRVLQCVSDGRSFCLLERFAVDTWAEAVARHRPATASLVPAALRMVLESDLDAGALSSLRSVISGTAPLDPDDADAFRERFGVPVLVSYAATEFGGGVAGWNLADHEKYWATKRGSVGRAHGGCELRVVDPGTGDPVPADSEGLLEVRAAQLEDPGWIRTTDVARIDEDGFLFILGRSDQAIIRGGFKVRPDDVRAALERHPGVRGASVTALEDRRLGAVPVAVVEPNDAGSALTEQELLEWASGVLARYELPTRVLLVETLPRTDSGKVDLRAVRALLEADVLSAGNGPGA